MFLGRGVMKEVLLKKLSFLIFNVEPAVPK
jgi:hypothetical protein